MPAFFLGYNGRESRQYWKILSRTYETIILLNLRAN